MRCVFREMENYDRAENDLHSDWCTEMLLPFLSWMMLTVLLSLSAASLLLKKYHGGYVVIRLALAGHKQANRPFYRIVAAYNKRARDGKYIEQLGSYDPLPNIYNEKLVSLNFDRIKYWIGSGAHPTNPVSKLLGVYLQYKHSFRSNQHCTILLSACQGNYVTHIDMFIEGGPSITIMSTYSF